MKIEITDQFTKDLKKMLYPNLFTRIKRKFQHLKWRIQRFKRGYSDYDAYDISNYMQKILPKVIYQMRDNLHGSARVDLEDFEKLPKEWVEKKEPELKQWKQENDNLNSDKWWFILTRIAYCLEESDNPTEETNEYNEEYKEKFKDCDITELITHIVENKDDLDKKFVNRNFEIARYREKMKDEAFDLIKKYFFSLWD